AGSPQRYTSARRVRGRAGLDKERYCRNKTCSEVRSSQPLTCPVPTRSPVMFDELGTTPDEVADALRARGIMGVRNTAGAKCIRHFIGRSAQLVEHDRTPCRHGAR